MKQITLMAMLVLLLLPLLTGCAGGEKYQVDYCGQKDCYTNAKDAYRAGAAVKLYYDLIATDTDYRFLLDGEPVPFSYDEKKGYVIEFTMPAHDVKLECETTNSMVPVGMGMNEGNPLRQSDLEELAAETGCRLRLPPEQFRELKVTRINGDPALYSLDFVWSGDGNAYTFRLQKSPEAGDISGMYYSWTYSESHEEPDFEVCLSADGQGVCLWQDDAFTYALSMDETAERDALVYMREILTDAREDTE